MEVQLEEFKIPTADGHSLTVSKFHSKKAINQVLVITSATGVLQKYYARFAHFFALKGLVVYTFDYHGIGKSSGSEADIKSNTSTIISWGRNDLATVVAVAKNENPTAKLTLVGHSLGGQLLGFNTNYNMVDKVVLVACQTGYWKYFDSIHKIKMLFFWYVMIPVLTPIFGYFPAKKLGLFENLPKPMVYQWSRWGKKPDYFMQYYDNENFFFDKLEIPLLALSFSQDSFAPKPAVDWLAAQYKNARIKRVHHQAKKEERHVGHFGFFKSWAQEPYWEQCLNYIQHGKYEA